MNNPYTVILLYPEHIADHHGECYIDHVSVNSQVKDQSAKAVERAKRRAEDSNDFEKGDMDNALLIAVFPGHLESVVS